MSFVFKAESEPRVLSIAELNPNPGNILKQAITFLRQSNSYTYSMNVRRQSKSNDGMEKFYSVSLGSFRFYNQAEWW